MADVLYSVWNRTKSQWATVTNYSTEAEAIQLMDCITRACKDVYVVQERPFGSLKERPPEWKQ